MSSPWTYQAQNMISEWNMQPSEVKGRYNNATQYYKRYLYNKVYSTLKFGLPDNWDLNYFRYLLFHWGSMAVIYTNEFGWVDQPYSVEKININYNPEIIQVYNQFIKERKTGIVGVNCGIVKIFDDYFGIDDLVTHYAEKLASVDRSVDVNLMNSNVTVLLKANDKKEADTLKTAYAEATTGKPFVAVNKSLVDDGEIATFFPGVATNYIADKLLETRRAIVNEFLTEIGIRNANYDKKERLNSQEVSENNDETSAIISIIFDNIRSSFEKINKSSGLNLTVGLNYNNNDPTEPVQDEGREIA